MKPSADLSLLGIAKLVAAFLDRLGLDAVTLVGNDTGGAVVRLLAADGAPRIDRVVLVSGDAFGNFPPGLTGKTLALADKLPFPLFSSARSDGRGHSQVHQLQDYPEKVVLRASQPCSARDSCRSGPYHQGRPVCGSTSVPR